MIFNIKQKNKKKIYFFLSLSVFLLFLNLLPIRLINEEGWSGYEKFNLNYQSVTTIEHLHKIIDDSAHAHHCKPKTLEYTEWVTEIIKQRFRHGYSHYYFNQNWVASVLGYVYWRDLSAVVDPNDLMLYPNAACSQQSIVMMEILKRQGVPFCKVGWNHHFTLCAWIEGGWRYYDPNMEPIMSIDQRKFNDNFLNIEFLASIYKDRINSNNIEYALGVPKLGRINEFPAPKALLFHRVTKVISITLWIFALIPAIYFYRPVNIKTKKARQKVFRKRTPKFQQPILTNVES